ncbi:MAG: bifunctional lysine ketoglutarate reductase /saccharopine dehydrogenase family protein [Bacteroidia bacterium]|nr:bifunctional lysine ketoglutarate reductase /saccharopine dehydrogenase family protein [Bacteroidia bacterium]
MINCIGVRKETKDITQRRVPLSPEQLGRLIAGRGLRVLVEPMERRVFADQEYISAGAELTDDFRDANVVFGVKEIQPQFMLDDKAYMFFSHTVKGQPYNMPMLRYILDHRITLIDYELVKDAQGRRLVFFGNFAGLAGMIDSLWALGRRLLSEGIASPFAQVKYATEYELLHRAEEALKAVGEDIAANGLPDAIVPFITGFTGYGNVSRGAQHLYDLLPTQRIEASELAAFMAKGEFSNRVCYKVEFREEDMFEAKDPNAPFVLQHFYEHPEFYQSKFDRYLPHLTLMVNGIYWEARYPRLLSIEGARALWSGAAPPRLRVVGDITCDIDGSVQLNVKETSSVNPVYVYEPLSGNVIDGWEGAGPVILAVDKLPTELPREASAAFGASLEPLVPALAAADFTQPFETLDLPPELKNAIIAHQGSLVERFRYLEEQLVQHA